ncbi:hypothetical protein, partial [Leptospira ilyithenensis]
MNKLSGGIIGTGVGMMAGAVKVVANTISNAIGSVSNTMGAVAMINPITRVGAAIVSLDKQLGTMTKAKEAMNGIRSNEQSIIKKHVTSVVASATGIPPEVASSIVADYKGSRDAKKARNAVNSNPIGNVVS